MPQMKEKYFFITLLSAHLLLVVPLLILFLTHRWNPSIAHRSPLLTCVLALSNILLAAWSLMRLSYTEPYSCGLELWTLGLGLPLSLLALAARYAHLIVQVRSQRAIYHLYGGLYSSVSPPTSQYPHGSIPEGSETSSMTPSPQRIDWVWRNRRWFSQQALVAWVGLAVVAHTILTAWVAFADHAQLDIVADPMDCVRRTPFTPETICALIYIITLFPALSFQVLKIRENYGIIRELFLSLCTASLAIGGSIVLTTSSPRYRHVLRSIIYEAYLISAYLILVAWPLASTLAPPPITPDGQCEIAFQRALSHPESFEKFKGYAMADLSIQQVMLYLECRRHSLLLPRERKTHIQYILETYLQYGSHCRVNIPKSTLLDLVDAITLGDKEIDKDILNPLQQDVWSLLRAHTWPRYCAWSLSKEKASPLPTSVVHP
ncbi:hypothetical protein BJ684DRAFT_18909 [Piptocephalis cylindrospora]|uniref:RGS domain-containing protein n=1 Tax=Piptocephalis cylindrospora TaxID=1907219 RepID=A0A4P9Y6U8_9FUNG|nr:hypothetical protein BJ684DRAFT_18909 [Piptocephalis cylindrospora]|eukprot:RKP14693.1 hypothetical protein BJ684DRAFT_18909 [Piptocephalis cylindrospora]